MRTRELLGKIDRTLERMDEHMARSNDLLEGLREGNRLHREALERSREEARRQHERDLREHLLTRAAVENNNRVTRELVLEGREHRKILGQIEQGIHAQTQGLLHVLDELRGGRGPGAAPAS